MTMRYAHLQESVNLLNNLAANPARKPRGNSWETLTKKKRG